MAYLVLTLSWWVISVICGWVARFISWWIRGAVFAAPHKNDWSYDHQNGDERRAKDRNSQLFWIDDDTSSISSGGSGSDEIPSIYYPHPIKGSKRLANQKTTSQDHAKVEVSINNSTERHSSILAQRRVRQRHCAWYNEEKHTNSDRVLLKGFIPTVEASSSRRRRERSRFKKRLRDNEELLYLVNSLDSVYNGLLPVATLNDSKDNQTIDLNCHVTNNSNSNRKIRRNVGNSRTSLTKFLGQLQSTLQILVMPLKKYMYRRQSVICEM